MRSVVLVVLVVALALAGCSKPPSGNLKAQGPVVQGQVEGSAVNDFTAARNPYNDTIPGNPTGTGPCSVPIPGETCTPAKSTVHVAMTQLPAAAGYHVWLAGGATAAPMDLGELKANKSGMDLTYTVAQDLTGRYNWVELRLGSFVLAHAPAKTGQQPFGVLEANEATTLLGSYKGADLSYTVGGLPQNATVVGGLYTQGENGPTLGETFPITGDGEGKFHASRNIADYVQVRITVKDTQITLQSATL